MNILTKYFKIIFGIISLSVASGIAHKNETEKLGWDYWEKMKIHKWKVLTDEEKEKLIVACQIINDDVGAVMTREQIIRELERQLPKTEPNVGLSYPSEIFNAG